MAGLLLALLLVGGVIGVCAIFYRVGMQRSDEIMEVLEPDEPEDDGTVGDEIYGSASDDQPLPDIGSSAPSVVNGRSTAERLAELDDLLAKGLINPAEHHEQRAAILRSI